MRPRDGRQHRRVSGDLLARLQQLLCRLSNALQQALSGGLDGLVAKGDGREGCVFDDDCDTTVQTVHDSTYS